MTKKGDSAQKTARPFVKWVGGKWRLVPQLLDYFPDDYNNYFEPFIGGGALFFATSPKSAQISDLNTVLIAAYKRIKNDVNNLITELCELESRYKALEDLDAKKDFYLDIRSKYNNLENTASEKVPLLIFLNKTCFNGMYRENKKGGFNVPFGKHPNPTICDEKNLRNVSKSLKGVSIKLAPYQKAITKAKPGDFVYFDPPYYPLNETSSFTAYQADGFSAKDQEELRDIFKELSERGCKVMLSNSDSEYINELYKDFNIHKINASRSINSNAAGRGKITEVLVTNY